MHRLESSDRSFSSFTLKKIIEVLTLYCNLFSIGGQWQFRTRLVFHLLWFEKGSLNYTCLSGLLIRCSHLLYFNHFSHKECSYHATVLLISELYFVTSSHYAGYGIFLNKGGGGEHWNMKWAYGCVKQPKTDRIFTSNIFVHSVCLL